MRRAKWNALSNLLSQIVYTAVGLLIPWTLIEHFGSEAYGATTSIAQFLGYISFFEGGIGRIARGALYRPLAIGDEEEVCRVYTAIKRFFSIIGWVFVGYSLIIAFFYYDIADVSVFDRKYVFALVLVIALSKFAEYMWGISNITLLNADQRQYVVNSVSILSNILNLTAIMLLVTFDSDILFVKLASSLVFVLKPVVLTIYIKSHYRFKITKARYVLQNKATGIAQHMAYVIQNSTDVMILTIFADLKAVAVYSVYHLITFSLRSIIISFTGGMEAVFGDMIAKNESEELRTTYKKYKFILTVLVIAIFGTAAILIVPFVKLYTSGTTDANYDQPVFALIMVVAEALNCLTWPCFTLTIAANQLRESRLGAYSEAAINIVVSIMLVFWNPLVGIALGTLISVLFRCFFYIIFSGKHILKSPIANIILRFLLTVSVLISVFLIGSTIMSGVLLYNFKRWIIAGFCTVFIVGLIGVCIGIIEYKRQVVK